MIKISAEWTTVIMLTGILLGVLTGVPIAFPIGALALLMGFLLFGMPVFDLLYSRLFEITTSYVLVAIPLFVFMGIMLEKSGIADAMFDALYLWLGGLKGGLAIATVLIGTVVAATVGIIGASVTMMALTALPAMIKRGYDKALAAGTVCASGCLGILIPPSVMLVIYGPMALISVGKLFMGAFIPGFLLAALYLLYIALRCQLQPELGPVVPAEERAVPLMKKTVLLIKSLIPPSLLVLSVLGVIFLGIAPPTEAAAIGSLAATLLVIAYRKFNFGVLRSVSLDTLRVTSMILIIGGCSYAFVGVFIGAGCGKVVEEVIIATPGGAWGAFAIVQFIIFILGFFMDWLGIVFIMVPIVTPVAETLGFDALWFAMMICLNFQTSFMTPPFATAIFYVRGSAAPELGLTMADIIRGVIPFVVIILVGLALCVAFPQLITWLPSIMIK